MRVGLAVLRCLLVTTKLRVNPGILRPSHATATVAWLNHGRVVGKGRTYRPRQRDVGDVLRARITVRCPRLRDHRRLPEERAGEKAVKVLSRVRITGR